jgi:hypothetical protein
MSTVSTTIKDIYRNSLKGNVAGYNVRIQIQKWCILLNIAKLSDLKIDKDNKGGFKTAYVPMTICAYQVIILKNR